MNIETKRHSLAHILAMAVLKKYPKTKIATGPAIENGFYYDFDFEEQISEANLKEIQDNMKKIISVNLSFQKIAIDKATALKKFENNEYKTELIKELLEKKEILSFYQIGDFIDLCSGPHVDNTQELAIDAFKLTKIAGAYWRGNKKNKMLTRIYGVAFETKEELKEYEKMMEEAKKKDHRKLGKMLDLFVFSDLVGPGLPLFTPKGVIIIDELKKYIEKICGNYGFKKVLTPHLAKISLYEHSGHAKKFSEELFRVSSQRNHEFIIRPVLCPHQTQIYASKPRSYRDLPIRYMETEKMYRAEKPGEIGGLNRVYAITVEDGHIFCRLDQVKDEIKNLVNIIKDFYSALGMWGKHWVSLSVRDRNQPERYIGEPKDWNKCEKILKEVSDEMGLNAKRCEGEAALYGPKLDFMFKDALGKEIQIPTVQLDFATPKRFNLVYTNEKGKEINPVMVHRAILGSYERFLVLLLEHYGGAFPFWLAPVQVKILPVVNNNEKLLEYAKMILEELKNAGIRTILDISDNTFNKKIRNVKKEKIPYFIIIGEKDMRNGQITLESRNGQSKQLTVKETIQKLEEERKL